MRATQLRYTKMISENLVERSSLIEAELETLFCVSQVLGRSLQLRETLQEVLKQLHDHGYLRSGMVCLLDDETDELIVSALHNDITQPLETIRYHPGEGLVGEIMKRSQPLVVECIANEPRFLDR